MEEIGQPHSPELFLSEGRLFEGSENEKSKRWRSILKPSPLLLCHTIKGDNRI